MGTCGVGSIVAVGGSGVSVAGTAVAVGGGDVSVAGTVVTVGVTGDCSAGAATGEASSETEQAPTNSKSRSAGKDLMICDRLSIPHTPENR
jgi:hypothetical protein